MNYQLKPLEKSDFDQVNRQVIVFSCFRPLILLIVGVFLVLGGQLQLLGAIFGLIGLFLLLNAVRWCGHLQAQINRRRPIKMKVYFSKINPFSPFQDLQATLYDSRQYDPINQAFKPKWFLLGTTWDTKPVLGDAQECLVYVDRENGQVYAFSTASGYLFTKPYIALPWKKLDVQALIQSGQAKNEDLIN